MTTIFDCNGITISESAGGSALVIWSEDSDMQSPEQARDLALALLRWSTEHGAPLVWANLPAEWHDDAKKHGLVQVKRTDTLEANIGLRARYVACRSGDLVVYDDEICGAGTCLRPPGHDGRHDQFDSPQSADSVKFHAP